MTTDATRAAIRAVYRQVHAPDWAAANLDGLADVLRDLSWLPPGPVHITVPDLAGLSDPDRRRLHEVLRRAVAQTRSSPHQVRVEPAPPGP